MAATVAPELMMTSSASESESISFGVTSKRPLYNTSRNHLRPYWDDFGAYRAAGSMNTSASFNDFNWSVFVMNGESLQV
ncbi:hypothetical protein sscle_16g109270 [Sclerotinia sclerotiorum 1980 UF-70]|uniref:Uncharacterized protein n=1 Tax=Sclerotinia sclerotiorum (strain ATCC 18683 / 1980 / Ss-1) TaxID=665079 RepID=A0A1D9QMK2_SCLS1|nr:hypothetical protein sscle_16g109270 [Sclerotinia sclerotiorum 1980 UF-70]